MGANYNGNIVDLLITQFGLGIFSQYFIGESDNLLDTLVSRDYFGNKFKSVADEFDENNIARCGALSNSAALMGRGEGDGKY